MTNHYSVTLDESRSYLTPSQAGFTFESACAEIIDYAKDAKYGFQEALWETILEDGEDVYLTGIHKT